MSHPTSRENMSSSNSVHFSLRYSGAETNNHMINAGELARSLLGLSAVVDEIAQNSPESTAKVELLISAKFREGSAIADLVLEVVPPVTPLIPTLVSALSSAKEFLSTITDITRLITIFKGEEIPKNSLKRKENSKVIIQYKNCTFNSTDGAINLYGNAQIRRSLLQTCSPVLNGKAKKIDFLDESGKKLGTLDTNSAKYLSAFPANNNPTKTTHKNILVTIRKASLDDAKGWAFAWDSTHFTAVIQDLTFLQDVEDRRYQFAHGDRLRVDIEIITSSKTSGMKWTISKVHEFIPAQVQESFLVTETNSSEETISL